ncbi:UNVERIFIED_CONTAM: hypothetical protein Scaly_2240800 [Sesamum calycinum]|uniref:Uncharacterized protein n=1 Tax=Sesamum calycinum TaxID=2727403 RepID=A0AAW2M9B1_9LAMI
MPKLRYLNVGDLSLPDPLEGQDSSILDNLNALWSGDFRCTQKVVERIPNLKKLRATCWYSPVDLCCYLSNFAQLNKLESLILEGYSRLEEITFPISLKKLSLRGFKISWEKMTIIGSSLPNLEVLKLGNAFGGQEWNLIEGEFLQLKVLYIWNTDLMRWEQKISIFQTSRTFTSNVCGNWRRSL